MLSTGNHQNLNTDAQTYSPSVVDPNSFSRSDRSRLSSSGKAKEDEDAKRLAEEEEERKPDRLALLLAESKFSCRGLKNGYYADERYRPPVVFQPPTDPLLFPVWAVRCSTTVSMR